MNIHKQAKLFEENVLFDTRLTEYQKETLLACFKCGWEAYERSINNNNLIITDVNSIRHISKFSENISRCVEACGNDIFVKLPTQSPFMLTATTTEDLIDAVDLYKSY